MIELYNLNPEGAAFDWLGQQAAVSPGKVALIEGARCWNFAELDLAVQQLAASLQNSGILASQHVALLLPDSSSCVFTILALARLGAVLVPVNLRLAAGEMSWQVQQADCSALIYSGSTRSAALGIDSPNLRRINLDDLVRPACGPVQVVNRAWDLEDLQAIIFTSGTSGQPKGAQLSFGNHYWSARASAMRLGVEPDDRWLACLPFYHVGGLALIFRSVLYGTAIVLQDGFEPQALLAAIEIEHASLVSLVPTMLHRLLELPAAGETLAGLRIILLGGASASLPLLKRSQEAGLKIALTYGMTETASQVATTAPEDAWSKPGSVGKPLEWCKLAIRDENGGNLPPGQTGEIVLSGPVVMRGYYGVRFVDQPIDEQGWLSTGDLGYQDADGDLWVVQRREDLILSGGENVYPAEVERVLLEHPGVASACVIGLEDSEWGQRVAVAVVPAPGATLDQAGLIAYCREHLAGYKIPRQVFFFDRMPQTASGKILRRQVSEIVAGLFSLAEKNLH